MTRITNPETPTVDQNIQTAIPDTESVVDHATDATGDDPGHQNPPHDGGQEAEIGIEIGTENIDVDGHAKTKVHDEDHATMTKEMTNGSRNAAR
jgi:predicted metal-dependent enzyme (double-stranded beta helix superfamily)